MKKLNKVQLIGIGLVVLGISIPFLVENSLIEIILGVLTAVGVGFIFKWIPFKKQNLTE